MRAPLGRDLARLVRTCGFDLLLEMEPVPDPHDLGLIESSLRLTPEQRIDRLVALRRTADLLQEAVRATRRARDA